MRRSSKAIAAIFSATAAVAGALISHSAMAQTDTWVNPGSGDFNTGSNWSSNPTVPSGAAFAVISNGGTADISSADGTISLAQLWAGDLSTGGFGSVLQTGGTLNASAYVVVGHAGGTGFYNMTGGTINLLTGATDFRLFGGTSAASGTVLSVSGTSVINDAAAFDVGYNNGTLAGKATMLMSGGTVTTGGQFAVANGANTVGIVNMSGGTMTVNNNLVLGIGAGSSGSFYLGNANLTVTGTVEIGEGTNTTGYFENDGGNITLPNGAQFWIGDAANSTNNASNNGNGTYVQNGGSVTSHGWCVIGRGGGSTGVMTLNGGTFTHLGGNGNFEVGSYGGNNGAPNTATLNLNSGATLITDFIQDESPAGGVQTINFNGGVLEANNGDGGFIGGHQSNNDVFVLNVGNGGLIFNSNGNTDGISEPLLHSSVAGTNPIDGGLTKSGLGRLTLNVSNSFTGNVTVNGGTIQVLIDSALGNGNQINLSNGQLINWGQELDISASRTIVLTGTGYIDPGWGGPIYNNGTLQGGYIGVAVEGSIKGTGNLGVVFDSGTLVLNGSNSYAGATNLGTAASTDYYAPGSVGPNTTAGIPGINSNLQLGNENALPAGTALNFGVDPGNGDATELVTLDLNGHNTSIGTLSGSTNALIDNYNSGTTSTLTIGNNVGNSAGITAGTTSTYAGTIQNTLGTVNLTKIGPGTQVLSGTLTYSGPTAVNGGKLYITGSSTNSNFTVGPNASLAVTGTGTIGGTVLVNSGGSAGGTGTINGLVAVATGGTVVAGDLGSGTLSTAGGLVLGLNSTVAIGNVTNYAGSNTAGIVASSVNDSAGNINFTVATATGGLAVGNTFNLLSYGSETNPLGSNYTLNLPSRAIGTITDSNNMWVLTVTKVDYLNWSGGNGTGWTTANNWALNSTNALTTYIDSPGDSVVFGDTVGSSATVPGTFTVNLGSATLHPSAVTFNNSSHAYTVTGTGGIAGLEGITKMGSNVVNLDTANTYTGNTAIQKGTLAVGTGGSLSALTNVTLGSGTTSGTFQLGDSTGPVSTSVASLTVLGGSANAVIGGNAATSSLTINNSGADTYSGSIGSGTPGASTANALALGKTGGGTLTLTGSSTYRGGTTISGGIVSINNSSALGDPVGTITFTGVSAGAAPDPGNETLQATANVTIANPINLGQATVLFDTGAGNTMNLSGPITNTEINAQIIKPIGTGNLILSGTLNVTSQNNDNDRPSLFMGSNGTTATITGTGTMTSIYTSWYGNSTTLNLAPAGTLNLTSTDQSLDVGQQGGNGAVYQNAGTVNMTGNIYLGRWDSSYGSYTVNGGTLNVVNFLSGGGGNGNGNSYFQQSAGTVNVGNYTTIGQNNAGSNAFFMSGGNYNNSGNAFTLANGFGANGFATVAGGNLNVSGQQIVLAGNNNTNSTTILNLDGGVTTTNQIYVRNAQPTSIVNFNGGTLRASASSNLLYGATGAFIYSGGATIDSNGNNVTINQNLQDASTGSGYGLNGNLAVPSGSGGTGYVSAPVVTISGGSGTGASAVAVVSGGTVTSIVMTSPGTNYQPGDNIQFNLIAAGGSGASLPGYNPTLNAPNTAGLTKIGLGNLTLTGTNTYQGNTHIQAGTLTVAGPNALSNGTAFLSNHATLGIGYLPGVVSSNNVDFGAANYVMNTNGNGGFTPQVSGTSVQMSDRNNSEATSIFSPTPVAISDSVGFVATYTYTHANPSPAYTVADGVAFVIQNSAAGTGALFAPGGDLGYGNTATAAGITNSVAAGLEIYSNKLELGENGFLNNQPADNSTPFLSYASSDSVMVVYNGLAKTLTEIVTSNTDGSTSTIVSTGIDLASDLGGTAGGTGNGYIGFTAATGGANEQQYVSNFTFSNTSLTVPNTLVITNPVTVLPAASSTLQLAGGTGYSSGSVGPITVNAGGSLMVANNNALGATRGVLITPSITFNGSGGTVDVAGNALDITGMTIGAVNTLVAKGYNNGTWTNTTSTIGSITSSGAATDSNHLTAVGVISNTQNGLQLYGSGTALGMFDGANPSASDVLVKYTYYGDTNLNGSVDGGDYANIDNGFLSHLTGWFNGDFNYDGVVNGSDYTLMDNAYNEQGASLASLVASPTAQVAGGSAVPEPSTLGLLAIGAAGLLGRRRQRKVGGNVGGH